MPDPQCPCGSNLPFNACCQPYLDGTAEAPTPETLMRSRYTAFTRGDLVYLKKTWHPETVPNLSDDGPANWIGLEILQTGVDATGEHGQVEFIAKLIVEDRLGVLHEVSAFAKVDGRWVYHSGKFKNQGGPPRQISMKTPCPCGSGAKFKHCHYRRT